MKLNFWQWLGIICLIGGAIGYVWLRDRGSADTDSVPAPVETGSPATAPGI